MTSRERVLKALKVEKPDKVPFVETRVDPEIQRLLLGYNPLKIKKTVAGTDQLCSVELNKAIGLDNLQLRFLPPLFAESDSPDSYYSTKPLIRTRSDLDKMIFPDPGDPNLYKQAEKLINQGCGEYAVGATTRSGISATHMSMGLDGLSYALVEDAGLVDTVLARYTEWAIAILPHLKNMGVDFIWTADDMAYKSGPMFSPHMFREVFMPFMQQFGQAVREQGFFWILHSDGNILPLMDDLVSLGINAIHPIEPVAMDIETVKQDYGTQICLVGNIDLHYTLTRGKPEEVDKEVKERIEKIGQGGGYMISSANSLTRYCKVENVQAMINAIKQYRDYD